MLRTYYDRAREAVRELLTQLNLIGAGLLAYALSNPNAVNELIALLPPALRPGLAVVGPVAWFAIVQFAKARVATKAAAVE
jgi:hypothetical protein